jgi:hypothetical protein
MFVLDLLFYLLVLSLIQFQKILLQQIQNIDASESDEYHVIRRIPSGCGGDDEDQELKTPERYKHYEYWVDGADDEYGYFSLKDLLHWSLLCCSCSEVMRTFLSRNAKFRYVHFYYV